jgi:aspartyl/asparaginyl beta-hydroxylase (cupin superfamily)
MANAMMALQQGDPAKALRLLQVLQDVEPNNLDLMLNVALAHRVAGNLSTAVEVLDAVLAIDPYQFMALLSKAAILERLGQMALSAKTYEAALALAPPDDLTPPALQAPIAHGRQVLARRAKEFSDHLETRLAKARADLCAAQTARFDHCLDIFVGRKKVYVPQPLLMHFPGLPVIQFFDRHLFPWLPQLEAASDIIRAEMLALRAGESDPFAPYIAFPPGAPVNQWADLNHSRDWTSFWLWKDGVRQEGACALCPQTAKILEALPLAHQPDFAPTVVFSSLQAHTHIPPHTGSSNARLLVHLPLDLPGPARFRVGNDERSWQMGQAWVFDDTIEHEAWNDADAVRTILIFDVWNPYLTVEERELVSIMMAAKNEFMAR